MNLAIFVGPAKTGTTWLFEYAKLHPDLQTSTKDKEIQYFNKFYDKGKNWYESYFEANEDSLKCDFSPSYFSSDLGRLRLKKDYPHSKIIITLRNPSQRSISHYKHYMKLGLINENNAKIALSKNTTFVSNSFYSRYIEDWLDNFGSENVLILPIEEMQENLPAYLSKVCDFLDIPHFEASELTNKKVNEQSIPRSRFVASIASKIRRSTKTYDIRWLTSFAKKIGLKKLIYSGGSHQIEIGDSVVDELNELFIPENQKLKKYISPEIYQKYYENERT